MNENNTNLPRRHFLLSLGVGGAAGAAAVAAVSGGAAGTVEQAAKTAQAAAAGPSAGISAHMRNYYRTARV